jgi:hypothetical protein
LIVLVLVAVTQGRIGAVINAIHVRVVVQRVGRIRVQRVFDPVSIVVGI